ncbi:unnamed protein product [Ranitomeya imitator]|uniref:ELMO domain-containing protein n=1 Tax=Ranitomeya imitator TaxID=111125 RepID=A0ABN9M4D0_9NEOB|nr:unnamed protein product [Ranitomeya imitator]
MHHRERKMAAGASGSSDNGGSHIAAAQCSHYAGYDVTRCLLMACREYSLEHSKSKMLRCAINIVENEVDRHVADIVEEKKMNVEKDKRFVACTDRTDLYDIDSNYIRLLSHLRRYGAVTMRRCDVCCENSARRGQRCSSSTIQINLRICLLQISGYKKLYLDVESVRKQPYDADNPQHEQQLLELWDLLMPHEKLKSRITKQWGDIGFQGDDPKTDFRGMGFLGLANLL